MSDTKRNHSFDTWCQVLSDEVFLLSGRTFIGAKNFHGEYMAGADAMELAEIICNDLGGD